ncbi:MAG TPA: hypothetical protein VLE44_03345, partial [Candidatus Saccharimonadales bacterium]|nr:hypothetical protein [Candidatus Saccharimonadales bacterium]
DGILDKDKISIEPEKLIERTLGTNSSTMLFQVMEDLQMQAGNKVQGIIDYDLWIKWSREDIEDIQLKGSTPERMKKLEQNLVRMNESIYWATVQIPLIKKCSGDLLEAAKKKSNLSEPFEAQLRKLITNIESYQLMSSMIMTKNGDIYSKALQECKNIFFANGGTLSDIFDSV